MVDRKDHPAMAKPKGRPKRSDREYGVVKMERAVISMAKAVATHRGISVAELLSDVARGPIGQAYARMLRELEKEGEAKDGK